ncbi:arginine--tRNA ligase [Fictibacillus sp. KIGAM418]|uniref:Arginine--tRNA ligase n=1 Tax=Fictibacillus marinisediminis TaxID=2878389 RepID=A0A9X2BEX9_9BACL|nr:arginine--tRNA ligase [Fictibacillus marinisediminis]MCK6259121.1 arginine--tRNA ligase [Fictibacillus marinisediminis]
MSELKKEFAQIIANQLNDVLSLEKIEKLIEKPRHSVQGDIAFPCFTLAKTLKKAPQLIASDLSSQISTPLFERVEAQGPYINGFYKREAVSKEIVTAILKQHNAYGSAAIGNGEHITIDLSSPNIAKPFSMGHLRSTVIGNALANLTEKCGYKPVRINHIGDWGTQFGKLIVAYKRWGSEETVKQNPIKELLSLYVKFHKEAESQPALEDEARFWFKKLEDKNEEATALWKWFRDESLQEFSKIYSLLDIEFDTYHGEAFYNDKMENTVALLKEKGLLTQSDGAKVVKLDDSGLPPCLIKKSDGATLYATRDLTAALYRQEIYHFVKSLYVVGHEQSLHFQQIFLVLQKMGYHWAEEMVHIPFGFILKDGKKMSTRKGKVVLLEEVIQEAITLAKKNIELKNPGLPNKEEVAKQIGVGSIIFHDLKNERLNNIEFSLEDMLKFEGETGLYVQYAHARACSILRKAGNVSGMNTGLDDDYSWELVKTLMAFPDVIQKSLRLYEPSQIAKYLINVAQEFNAFYSHIRVLEEDETLASRVSLVNAVTVVLKEGLRLLGIKAPEEM